MATETLKLNTAEEADPLLKKDEEKDDDMEDEEMTGKNSNSVTPISERPARQRKKTERYISPTPFRSPSNKPVSIEQGRGTRLKEIPNVAYKLSKRKPDDNLFLLHTILYGKKGKAQMLKKNIGQFSGFVWSEQEEEKLKTRTKEKLEKCIKEKLIDFCDVLDIPINKSNVKKEELSVRLLEFLVNPKATRDIVLADSETKTKKRKKSTPKNVTSVESSDVPAKRRRQMKISEKKQDPETEEGNDDGDVGSEEPNDSQGKDDTAPEKNTDKNEDTETEDEKDKSAEKNPTDKKSTSKTTKEKDKPASEEEKDKPASEEEKDKPASEEEKSLTKSARKSSRQVDKSISSSSKKQKVDKDVSSKEKGKKQTSKTQTMRSKDQGKTNKKAKKEPTQKELHVVVAKILKEVDFDTATLSDILRKLGSHFGVDLMHRKAEVKDIITAAIKDMSDDETEDECEEDETERD